MLRRFICFAIFPLVLAIQGCGGAGLPVVPPDPTIRYVNASPNSGTVDFFLDGDVVGSALPYLGSTANFASRTPGDQELSVAITGDPEAQWTEAIAPERDKHYVAVAFGLRTPPNTELAKRMRIGILTADRARPNNGARLIVFHAYSRATGFDTPSIDFQNPGDNPQYHLDSITFGNALILEVNAGTQTFVARRNQTEAEITPQVTKLFEAGKIYLVLVTGVEGDVGATAPKIEFIELATKN